MHVLGLKRRIRYSWPSDSVAGLKIYKYIFGDNDPIMGLSGVVVLWDMTLLSILKLFCGWVMLLSVTVLVIYGK